MWRYIHQCVVKLSFKQILCQRDIKKKAMVFVKLISLNIWSTLMYICFPWVIHQKLKLVHTVLKSEYFVKNETVINLLQFWVSCQKLSAWKKIEHHLTISDMWFYIFRLSVPKRDLNLGPWSLIYTSKPMPHWILG